MDSSVLAAKRVLVVGDCMLDQYWFGDAERISPEAPVPVVRVLRTDARLGGAANVALNITTLGAKAALMSVAGEDEAGHTLRSLWKLPALNLCFRPILRSKQPLSCASLRVSSRCCVPTLKMRPREKYSQPFSVHLTIRSNAPTPWFFPTTAKAGSTIFVK